MEELKKIIPEMAKLRSTVESLKQDNDALRVSLESSERIRVQQKELIAILQKSHAMISESSVVSFNSMSSISHKGEYDLAQVHPFPLHHTDHHHDHDTGHSMPSNKVHHAEQYGQHYHNPAEHREW